ncbi:J domain-containing protein [Spirulina sp. CS-785/01]|uniref:J domain-containing protein n=1 Tax=Spirulina sp. CS-785/01 TaxID=3021716 RepID=UPI00232E764B|nr:J domain-containing protein [Spirulina sp. CS-785/01]MDB9315787.1 J domain-containing protein [Spirulina sp. CS-785/01]
MTKAQFDSASALIYLDFQNAYTQSQRRCVQRITAWQKVYFVEFYLDTVKQAYRKEAKQFYPDTGGNSRSFSILKQAYEIALKNSTK